MISPYKGLVPYTEDDREYFFGRDVEREMIGANLLAARLTLLYGASGVGKSSVLNAGVVPHLREMAREAIEDRGAPEFAVVVFRSWRDDPLSALGARIDEIVSSELNQQTGAARQSTLAKTLENNINRLGGRIIVILDQFEEYFLYHGQESGEGTFAAQFPAAISRHDLRVSFLISIREDALAKLDRFKGRIPNLFDNYLRIEHLDYNAARDAITRPIAKHLERKGDQGQPKSIEPGLVEVLLQQVRTGEVVLGEKGRGVVEKSGVEHRIEAPYLQLVMERLWNEEVKQGSRELRLATLTGLGGAESIVRSHLDNVMNELPEGQQAAAAEIFDRLVTPTGAKIAHTIPDLVSYAKADNQSLQSSDIETLLESLSQPGTRILRAVPGPLDQPQLSRFEIFHDVLSAAILNWRARYVQKQDQLKAERQAAELVAREQKEALMQSEQRRARQFRWGLIVVSTLLVATIFFAALAWNQSRQARAAEKIALSRELATHATSELMNDPELSLRLASEAIRIERTQQADDALRRALEQAHPYLKLAGHSASVTKASFSNDGQRLMTVDQVIVDARQTIRVWDAHAGKEITQLRIDPPSAQPTDEYIEQAYGAAFSPDGKLIAAINGSATPQLWDAETGKLLRELRGGHTQTVSKVIFSADGSRIVTDGLDGIAVLWDAQSGQKIRTYKNVDGQIPLLSISPNGKLLLTETADDKAILVRDVETGRIRATLRGHTNTIHMAAFSPDSKLIATYGIDQTVRIWDAATGGLKHTWSEENEQVFELAFSPDGTTVATGLVSGGAHLWKVGEDEVAMEMKDHNGGINRVAFSPDGAFLATAGDDKTIRVYGSLKDLSQPMITIVLRGHAAPVLTAEFSPDGRRLITADIDGDTRLWELDKSATVIRSLFPFYRSLKTPDGQYSSRISQGEMSVLDSKGRTLHKEPIIRSGGVRLIAASFSPDGRYFAYPVENGVAVVATGAWKKVTELPKVSKQSNGVAFTKDGKYLIHRGRDVPWEVWSVDSWQPLLPEDARHDRLTTIAHLADKKLLLVATEKGAFWVFNTETQQLLKQLPASGESVNVIAATPDGALIATAGKDPAVKIWSTANWQNLATLAGHTKPVGQLVFSPANASSTSGTSGQLLASVGEDNAVTVWNMNGWRKEVEFLAEPGPRQPARFSEDGSRLQVNGRNYARVRFAPFGEVQAIANRRSMRELTEAERRKYLHQ
jgi:WD40 repeat protein